MTDRFPRLRSEEVLTRLVGCPADRGGRRMEENPGEQASPERPDTLPPNNLLNNRQNCRRSVDEEKDVNNRGAKNHTRLSNISKEDADAASMFADTAEGRTTSRI